MVTFFVLLALFAPWIAPQDPLATAYAIERGLRIKFSTELWEFSDRDALSGRTVELSMHTALAGSF